MDEEEDARRVEEEKNKYHIYTFRPRDTYLHNPGFAIRQFVHLQIYQHLFQCFRPVKLLEKNHVVSLGLHLPPIVNCLTKYGLEGSMSRCQHIASQKQIYTSYHRFSLAIDWSIAYLAICRFHISQSLFIPTVYFALSYTHTDPVANRADYPR